MSHDKLFERILLVEDELNLARTLKLALKQMDLVADHALNLEQARDLLVEKEYDLCLLDRMLPDGDGIELCEEIKATSGAPMILILSAKGEVEERIEGLEEGADDYLPKPFSYEELAARIKALSRRHVKNKVVSFDIEHRPTEAGIDLWSQLPKELQVLGPQGWVKLTQLEFRLVTKFLNNPKTPLTREELLKDVWGFQWLPKTRTVDFFMGRIRKHFEKNAEEPTHFVTVRGVGYRFDP